ncbi:hypothetical protein TSAR_002056 [Trichomalopsis sarcophagae]|uniref:Uncharacterized protein n=1 Tax=Trichomalopsis sarcophagae TaxID=543379 RepID=A0A232F1I6_9HYME|nr:hypothetical protein TSAR_002056 [Trichomalopsis sarcophagae]
MPSAEETSYLIEVMPDSGQDDFTTHDVDVLVSRIKENLRLSGLKSKRLARREMRSSPYKLPYSDWTPDYKTDGSLFSSGDDEQEQQHRQSQLRRNYRKKWRVAESEADSYERFKALLRNNLLIKEAVKRLQTYDEEDEDKEGTWEEEEESGSTRRASTTSATSTTLDGLDSMDD